MPPPIFYLKICITIPGACAITLFIQTIQSRECPFRQPTLWPNNTIPAGCCHHPLPPNNTIPEGSRHHPLHQNNTMYQGTCAIILFLQTILSQSIRDITLFIQTILCTRVLAQSSSSSKQYYPRGFATSPIHPNNTLYQGTCAIILFIQVILSQGARTIGLHLGINSWILIQTRA